MVLGMILDTNKVEFSSYIKGTGGEATNKPIDMNMNISINMDRLYRSNRQGLRVKGDYLITF